MNINIFVFVCVFCVPASRVSHSVSVQSTWIGRCMGTVGGKVRTNVRAHVVLGAPRVNIKGPNHIPHQVPTWHVF